MVAQNQRMDPAHRVAKRLLEQGEMGRVLSFQTTFSHDGPERWIGQKSGAGIWFFDAGQTGFGVLGDLGVHKLDMICWLTGEKIEKAISPPRWTSDWKTALRSRWRTTQSCFCA